MRYRLFLTLIALVFIFFLGIKWVLVKLYPSAKKKFPAHSVQLVEGWVDSLPVCRSRRCSFDFVVYSLNHRRFNSRLCVYWYGRHPDLAAGQNWSFYFKTFYSRSLLNVRQLWSHGCVARGDVVKDLPFRLGNKPCQNCFWIKKRYWYENVILHSVSNVTQAGSLSALTVGARNLLTQKDWRVYQQTGTSHLVAVSGLHCGIVYLLFEWLLFKVIIFLVIRNERYFSVQSMARIGALMMTLVYAFLVGFSLPTERAWLMLLFSVLPGFFYIDTPWWRRIIFAFVVILFLQPGAIVQASFWLSFSAVASIAYVSRSRLGQNTHVIEWLKLNMAITLGLMPLTLFYFSRVSLASPLANLVAVPCVTLMIVPGCILAVVVSFFSVKLAGAVFYSVGKLFAVLWWSLTQLSHLNWVFWLQHGISVTQCLVASLGAVFFISPLPLSMRLCGCGLCFSLLR